MKRAGKYLRISDDREGRELGVERQEEDCDQLAQREGVQVVGRYVDNDLSASAKARKPRKEYQRLLADARAGKLDMIVAYTSSRLTRRPREHEDLIDLAVEHGIEYRFVRSPSFDLNTSTGRRIARILAANDAGEAEDIAERVAREVRQRAADGRYHGGPRGYGITADGAALVEDEAAEVRAWCATVLAGGSLWGIRGDLDRRGVPTVSGGMWRAAVIRKILLNPRTAGLRVLDGVEHPAPHPPIVPVETWRAVASILEHPSRVANHTGTARRHLGAGLFVCQRCQRTVNTNYGHGRQLVYKCRRCWRQWRADPINEWVTGVVEGVVAKEDAVKRLLPEPTGDVDTRGLAAHAAAIRQNMAALAGEFALAKGATRAALRDGLNAGEARLAEIDAMLADASRADPLAALAHAADPVSAWRDLDLTRRQGVVSLLMRVELGEPIRGRARWDPDRFITLTWRARA